MLSQTNESLVSWSTFPKKMQNRESEVWILFGVRYTCFVLVYFIPFVNLAVLCDLINFPFCFDMLSRGERSHALETNGQPVS
jgi:hypothetical protein